MKVYLGLSVGDLIFDIAKFLPLSEHEYMQNLAALLFDPSGEIAIAFIEKKVITETFRSGSPSKWITEGMNHRTDKGHDLREIERGYWMVDLSEVQLIQAIQRLTAIMPYQGESVAVGIHDEFECLAFYRSVRASSACYDLILGLWVDVF